MEMCLLLAQKVTDEMNVVNNDYCFFDWPKLIRFEIVMAI